MTTNNADALRALAACIRKHGTCAPAALEEIADRLDAIASQPQAAVARGDACERCARRDQLDSLLDGMQPRETERFGPEWRGDALAATPAPAVAQDDARAVEASRKAQWAAVVQEPAFRLAEAFKEPGSTVTITKADAAAIGRCMDYFILATTRPSAAPASEAREGGWRWKYMRLVDAFDRYAQPWMTDDGEGGFAGALQRMALDAGKIALVREEMRAFQRGEIESKWAMFNISKTIDPDPYANEPPAAAPKPAAETGSTGARYFVSGPAMSFYTDDANAAEALLAAAGVDRDDWTITDLASPTQDAAHGGRDDG